MIEVKIFFPLVAFAKEIYQEVVNPFPITVGKAISKKEREDLKLGAATLVYGEINFDAFGNFSELNMKHFKMIKSGIIFEKIKKIYGKESEISSPGCLQTRGGRFYDLGSGTGKPVVAAAILHNFDICIGIELLEGLHNASTEIQQAYYSKVKKV